MAPAEAPISSSAGSMSDSPIWQVLIDELDLWQASGKTATLWWRDDDAIEETPQLHKLDALSCEYEVPITIAVIPAKLKDSLPEYLNGRDNFNVIQHGYLHQSHAAKGEKKIEIGGLRELDDIVIELSLGLTHLQNAFANQIVPVLVPPWNRIEARTYPILSEAGFRGLSSMWARKAKFPAEGLLQVNTHLDPVNWRQDRGFIEKLEAITQIHLHLFGRRTGYLDSDEPTGILTHHLVQTDEVWDFCRELFSRLNKHPATQWLDAGTIWRISP